MAPLRICYFGDYDAEYNRNDVIINGLRVNGVSVIECCVPAHKSGKFFSLIKAYWRLSSVPDVLIVGSSDTSRWIVPLARLLVLWRRPLVWDAFYSIYDSHINDRELAGKISVKAAYYWFIDWMACHLADRILLDTHAHIQYFTKTFIVRESKFIRVLVGSNLKRFISDEVAKKDEKIFRVNFYGKYIPLQGVPYIIRAAKLLEEYRDVRFTLIGKGQTFKEVSALADELGVSNVDFVPRIPYRDIPGYLRRADVSLGIFGNTEKALRVIPNKVYEATELGVAVITANTPGVRELFTDRENILLCKPADPNDLAAKILELRNNPRLKNSIAWGGSALFALRATPKNIGGRLLEDLSQWVQRIA